MEDMKELGQKIRQARLDRGISMDEVQQSTKIRKKYLKAIEEGEFDVVSQEVFLKGFLRVYANYVGLDGHEILNEYNRLKKMNQEDKEDGAVTEIEEDESTAEKILCFISNHLMKIVAAAVILAVVLSGGALLFRNGNDTTQEAVNTEIEVADNNQESNNSKKNNNNKEINSNKEINDSKETEVQEKGIDDTKDNYEKEDEVVSKRDIRIKVLETSWVKVVIDGKLVLEEMLSSGAEKSWHVDQNVELLIANAAGVKVRFNGKTFGPFGKQGEVIKKKFTTKNE